MDITADFIKQAIANTHDNYLETVTLAAKLRVHADGLTPTQLIGRRRPSEPTEIQKYRAEIYVPKTKNPISKVINSLEKIRRSQDWNIAYDEQRPAVITDEESLQSYCEERYPVHTSVTNWAFSELLKQYLLDANGVIAIIPGNRADQPANEYVKPVAEFFESEQILAFVEGEYAVLKSRDTSTYKTPAGRVVRTNGDIYHIFTDTGYYRYEQINSNRDLEQKAIYEHNIGSVPVFKSGGLFLKRRYNATLYESRIASMVPSLDEAAREYSDLQAEIVQHIHSEKYAYVNGECPTCKGAGTKLVETPDGSRTEPCQACKGAGSVLNISSYNTYLIQAAKAMENQLPTPPIGYVTKDTAIAKLQDERVRQHIYDALATLNMEFLSDTPLSQSGTAKEVDRDELNNFVNSIAEDIVRILDRVYWYINEYRYGINVPTKETREAMLPRINVPTKFDVISSGLLFAEFDAARKAGASPTAQGALEKEYMHKKFCVDPDVNEEAALVIDLDPLYGITEDDKMTRLANGGILQIDYVISCNITKFIRRAVRETSEEFSRMDQDAQYEMLIAYAKEIAQENASGKIPITQPLTPPETPPENK